MIKKILLSGMLAATIGGVLAQTNSMKLTKGGNNQLPAHRTCGVMDHFEHLKAIDPNAEAKKIAFDKDVAERILNMQKNSGTNNTATVVTIPVVFHVVYSTTAQNISDQRLMEQLDVLNKDYSHTNTDTNKIPNVWKTVAADCGIQFCLAQQDPTGAATTGITRTSTTVSSWGTNDAVKYTAQGGHDAWDRSKYLNIWVCNLGQGLLGYAQFPGQAAATDGVVFLYNSVGLSGSAGAPYNLGRTATHEVGHWLGLYHIWGDDGTACSGSDNVSDTPNQAGENYGCFTAGQVKTDACTAAAPGIMWQNYMDYTDDACMYMFTQGQKARVQATITGARASLATSPGCISPTPGLPVANFIANPTVAAVSANIQFTDLTAGVPSSWAWSATPSAGVNFSNATAQNPTATFANPGYYTIQLIASNSFDVDGDTAVKVNYITVGMPVANFTATPTNANVNANVQFTDLTTNAPTSWAWSSSPSAGVSFNNATAQNPIATFANPGQYTITLMAYNSFSGDTITKTNYITVSLPNLTTCDTLYNRPTDTYSANYGDQSGGYLAGTNSYQDKAKAELFSNYPTNVKLSGVWFAAAVAVGTDSVSVRVWDNNGTGGLPSTVLSTRKIYKGDIGVSTTSLVWNYVNFAPSPVAISGPFYAGIEFGYAAGDSIALLTTVDDSLSVNTGFEQFSTNDWHSYVETPTSWGVHMSNAILVNICPNAIAGIENNSLDYNVNIYPNPSTGMFNLLVNLPNSENVKVEVTNILGQNIYSQQYSNVTNKQINVDLGNQAAGTYFITVKTNSGITTKKVTVSK